MPLLPTTITAEVLKLTDPDDLNFVGFPETVEQVALNWVVAANKYFETVTFVGSLLPGTLDAADTAFQETLKASLASPDPAAPSPVGIIALDAAWTAYAAAITAGAVVTSAVLVPPAAPLSLAPSLAPFLVGVDDPSGPAGAMAAGIQTWAATGTYAQPPTSVPVFWTL